MRSTADAAIATGRDRKPALTLPYDIGAVTPGEAIPGLCWPIDIGATKRLQRAGLDNSIRLLDQADGEDRDLILKAIPAIHVTMLVLGTAWITAAAARRQNVRFVTSGATLYDAIDQGHFKDLPLQYDDARARFAAQTRPPPKAFLRRAAHNLLSNRISGWVRPRTTVLNHNPLARSESRAVKDRRFAFTTPDRLFKTAPDLGGEPAIKHMEIAAAFADGFSEYLENEGSPDTPPPGLVGAFKDATAQWLADVGAMDAALDRARLGKAIWTGTGNNIVTRLAQAAVREAGGHAVGFDHGGGGHHLKDLSQFATGELGCVTDYVTETSARGEMMKKGLAALGNHDWLAPEITSRKGVRGSFRWLAPGPPRSRPVRTIMYVATQFAGEFKHGSAPVPPDPVYAEWQGRLIDMLADAGYRVLVKGHPEGGMGGRPFSMSANGTFVGGRFHEVIDRADAFLFDYPATTTLWEAMCTDKHVVLIDLKLADWRDEFRGLLEQRCAVVEGDFDERNLPAVDREALLEAIEAPPGNDIYAERFIVGYPRTEASVG